jgi:hypothetical protein
MTSRLVFATAIAALALLGPASAQSPQTTMRPASSFAIDCSAFKPAGPHAYEVIKDTIIVQIEANNRFGYRAGQIIAPHGIMTAGVDLFDAVANKCSAI